MAMHLKVHVLPIAQSKEETWLNLSRAGFLVGQPKGKAGKPLAASTTQSHPHPSICVGIWTLLPHQVLVSTSSLWEQSHYSLWQEVSEGPGGLLSVSIGVVYYAH